MDTSAAIVYRLFVIMLLFRISQAQCSLDVQYPTILLSGVHFNFKIMFPAYNGSEAIPEKLDIVLSEKDNELYNATNISIRLGDGTDQREQQLGPVKHTLKAGHHRLSVKVYIHETDEQVCDTFEARVLSVPGWLTIFPPILTAVIAIVFRQVFIALIMGIWLAAFLGHGYNPLTAILRTIDTYIVDALVDHDHSAIIIATFFLGGLIGLVQRSGGGLGLAIFFAKFANSTRRASIVCFIVALLIFFDDYTCVLITGNSLRPVMDKAGVSRDKFAFIVQSMAPCVASFFPVSSWVGAQIGYVQSGFDRCPTKDQLNPFNIVIQTMPYRFLPLLMMFCVLLVCIMNRDFGCMLAVEKKQTHINICNVQGARTAVHREEEEDVETLPLIKDRSPSSDETDNDALFEGALSPKQGIPHRWFNAVVPFIIVIVVTFVGMIVSGYLFIKNNNKHITNDHIKVSVTNIFSNGDAISALIWSTGLAMVVIVIMLAIQRILTFKEMMESWMEGVKDILEPLIILILAWALGNVISEIQTSSFIAQALNSGNISAKYIPLITVVIGFFMAYCTGSAFGTMGILFPLVIPTVCQLKDGNKDALIQTSAAILSSCIFGNLMSPIADLTVLTRVSTRCDYNSHLKTCALYVLITGFISIIFGTLPVGAGLYPWWGAWLIMPVLLILIFIVFSSGHRENSRSLFKMGCPCVYVAFDKLYFKCASRLNVFKVKYLTRFKFKRMQPQQQQKVVVVEGEYRTAQEQHSSYFSDN